NRTSWIHPRSKHWHLIDYAVVRKRDRQGMRVTKSMCGADCWTDHRLIVTKLNIRVQPKRRPQDKKAPKRLNITQLKNTNTKQCFVDILEVRLESTPLDSQNVEADWATLRELVYNTATEILGPSTRKHKDWFDENCDEIKQLLDEKHRLHQAYISSPKSISKKDAYNTIHKTVPINVALDGLPTLLETQKAIRLLSSGKAPGSDSIPAAVYKEGGSALTEKLHQLFLLMWQQETIPQEFKDASIIHMYK
ncbi:hypothetical protein LSAT2_017425, partial [Lamellibrachia satsuma]